MTRFDPVHEAIASGKLITSRSTGLRSAELRRLEERGVLKRVLKGVYLGAEVREHRLAEGAAWTLRRPRAVLGMLTAAAHHDLTDAFQRGTWLLIPPGLASAARSEAVNVVASSLLQDSRSDILTISNVHGVEVRLTSPDRTVIDLWRHPRRISREHALVALSRWTRSKNFRISRFRRLAAELRVWTNQIEPVLQGIRLGRENP